MEKPGPKAKPTQIKTNNISSKSPSRVTVNKFNNKKTSIVPPLQDDLVINNPGSVIDEPEPIKYSFILLGERYLEGEDTRFVE